jgi:hypothetical protein
MAITLTTLTETIIEVNRFMAAAREAQARLASDRTLEVTGCKETGRARRASLDLTRALARMRRRDPVF